MPNPTPPNNTSSFINRIITPFFSTGTTPANRVPSDEHSDYTDLEISDDDTEKDPTLRDLNDTVGKSGPYSNATGNAIGNMLNASGPALAALADSTANGNNFIDNDNGNDNDNIAVRSVDTAEDDSSIFHDAANRFDGETDDESDDEFHFFPPDTIGQLIRITGNARDLPDNTRGKKELLAMLKITTQILENEEQKGESGGGDVSSAELQLRKTESVINYLGIISETNNTAGDHAKELLKVLSDNQKIYSNPDLYLNNEKTETETEIEKCILSTRKVLSKIHNDEIKIPNNVNIALETELIANLAMMTNIKNERSRHQGPFHKQKILEEKKLQCDAASAIFESLIADVPKKIKKKYNGKDQNFDADAKDILEIFKARATILNCSIKGDNIPPEIWTTLTSEDQPLTLAGNILKKYKNQFINNSASNAAQDSIWIAEVIDAFLKKYPAADTRKGSELLAAAKGHVLNKQRNWQIVESEFEVPVSSSSEHQQPTIAHAHVKTTMTPAGHVLLAPGNQLGGRWARIDAAIRSDYEANDPNDSNRKIITGHNSHSTTEHLHAVNLAHTQVEAGKKTLFSAMRHGTLSAYNLHPDTIGRMHKTLREKLARELIFMSRPSAPLSTNPFDDDAPVTPLDAAWDEAMKSLRIINVPENPSQIPDSSIQAFIDKARNDKEFCALLRRRVALNRAREVFIASVKSKPSLIQRLAAGKPIYFHSISLITPDPFRHFLAKLMPSRFRKHDELTMRREEVQAWKDLQKEIETNQCIIGNQVVKAEILTFSVGVNQLALESGTPAKRALCSGWNMAADENYKNLKKLIGEPELYIKEPRFFDGQVGIVLNELSSIRDNKDTDPDTSALLTKTIAQIEALTQQIAVMWDSGQYRHADDQPYKFASRLCMLSELLGAAKAFNCKSGTDRTAQLDLEAKLLATQCEFRSHEPEYSGHEHGLKKRQIVPPHDRRSDFSKLQLLSFVLRDKTRTAVQRYNTGLEGSKLKWAKLPDSFVPAGADKTRIREEFLGLSAERHS